MKRLAAAASCVVLVLADLGCFQADQPANVAAPPAPDMPPGRTVTSDISFPVAEVAPMGRKLGGALRSLRNTDYEVDGNTVRVNTIEAANGASADAIMAGPTRIKPTEFLPRDGLIIYEFVGTDDALPEMRAGRSHLAAGR